MLVHLCAVTQWCMLTMPPGLLQLGEAPPGTEMEFFCDAEEHECLPDARLDFEGGGIRFRFNETFGNATMLLTYPDQDRRQAHLARVAELKYPGMSLEINATGLARLTLRNCHPQPTRIRWAVILNRATGPVNLNPEDRSETSRVYRQRPDPYDTTEKIRPVPLFPGGAWLVVTFNVGTEGLKIAARIPRAPREEPSDPNVWLPLGLSLALLAVVIGWNPVIDRTPVRGEAEEEAPREARAD